MMPNFTSSYDFGTGQLNALQQGDALAGAQGPAMSGGGELGGLVDKIINERRRKEQKSRFLAQQNQPREILTIGQQRQLAAAQNTAGIDEARGRSAEARALTERGPQRYIFGLGYAGGPNQTTANTSQMTGAQRRVLLPQNSMMESGPSMSRASFQVNALEGLGDQLKQPYDIQQEGARMYGWGGRPSGRG
jgi:hypothetical protein